MPVIHRHHQSLQLLCLCCPCLNPQQQQQKRSKSLFSEANDQATQKPKRLEKDLNGASPIMRGKKYQYAGIHTSKLLKVIFADRADIWRH